MAERARRRAQRKVAGSIVWFSSDRVKIAALGSRAVQNGSALPLVERVTADRLWNRSGNDGCQLFGVGTAVWMNGLTAGMAFAGAVIFKLLPKS